MPTDYRWISRDPIGESGGNNLYAYVLNNPARFFDPLGLDYTDANATYGSWGLVGTGGVMTGPNGSHSYSGGGIGTPGFSSSFYGSSQDISEGWNFGISANFPGGGIQVGVDSHGSFFFEAGPAYGPPGASATGYYVDPPWSTPSPPDGDPSIPSPSAPSDNTGTSKGPPRGRPNSNGGAGKDPKIGPPNPNGKPCK